MNDDDGRGKRSLIRAIYSGTQALRVVVKDAARARRIAAIVAKHGFSTLLESRKDESVSREQARRNLLGGSADVDVHAVAQLDLAGRAVAMLEELGPTFVKFGQILSTRPDLIPGEYATRLQALQDHVSAVPVDEVRRTIQTSLGQTIAELFKSFDDVPIASASIAQVHGAVLHDGTAVVVKVQRPGLRPIIESDLSLLRFLVDQVIDVFPEAETFDLRGMVREFEKSLRRELDFDVERQSLERFTRNFKTKPRIHIPTVHPLLSSKQVLTLERIRGQKLTALGDDSPAERAHRLDVAHVYLDAAYQMLFKDGFFHGDLHPGNVFVEEDGRLGLIDFGMVGRLSRQNRERLVDVLFSLMSEDLENVARIWFSIGKPGTTVDYGAFEAEVIDVLERHIVGRELDEWDLSAFFRDLAAGAVKHGIRLPSDFTMMFKAMVTTEGLARTIAAGINPIEAARPYIEELIRTRYSLERVKKQALVEGVRVIDLLWALPSTIERLVEKLEAGELRVRLRHDRLDESARVLSSAMNRVGLAVISASGAVTGALTMGRGPEVALGLSPLSLIAFAIAFASTSFFFFSMWRGRR
ncbi:MAG: AarF/UbiB family protein [Deltaproteobacteria bacterium]|nr:AarF/UbiB family protein [Deltaproteobacteria bacterium]